MKTRSRSRRPPLPEPSSLPRAMCNTKSSNIQGCTTRFQKLQSRSVSRVNIFTRVLPRCYATTSDGRRLTVSGRCRCRCREAEHGAQHAQSHELEKDDEAEGFWRHPLQTKICRVGLGSTVPTERPSERPLPVASAERVDSSAPLRSAGGRRLLVPPRRPE